MQAALLGRTEFADPHLDLSNNSIACPEPKPSATRRRAPTDATADTRRGGCWEETQQTS
jgi:hypothetical protein